MLRLSSCVRRGLWFYAFSKSAGDAAPQYGTSAAVDKAGSTIVAGYLKGTIDLGGGALFSPDGMFLAKFAP